MANVDYMRLKLMHTPRYDNPTWHNKVKRMSDNQVIAVYHKFKRDGYLDEKIPKTKTREPKTRQYSIFDYMAADGSINITKPYESILGGIK